ncbi:hypothetical protein ACQY0O_005905 [Thecaphora frezii]
MPDALDTECLKKIVRKLEFVPPLFREAAVDLCSRNDSTRQSQLADLIQQLQTDTFGRSRKQCQIQCQRFIHDLNVLLQLDLPPQEQGSPSSAPVSPACPAESSKKRSNGAVDGKVALSTVKKPKTSALIDAIDDIAIPAAAGPTSRLLAPCFAARGRAKKSTIMASDIRSPNVGSYNDIAPANIHLQAMQAKGGRPGVPWGVQYFLVSLVSHDFISWDNLDVEEGIDALRSDSNLASIDQFFRKEVQAAMWCSSGSETLAVSRNITEPELRTYHELDREQRALASNKFAGLGVFGDSSSDDTYGGKVIFEGEICWTQRDFARASDHASSGGPFRVRLSPPRLGPSCRFTRRFGSERFIRLKVDGRLLKELQKFQRADKDSLCQAFLAYLLRPFRLLGRVYRPLFVKDDTIWLFQVEELFPSAFPLELSSIWDFLDYHGPWSRNLSGRMGKYLQRLALGVSVSVPAAAVDEIIYEDDIHGDSFDIQGSRRVMTDGAASASRTLLKAMSDRLGYDVIPSAIQARVAGAKGVWFMQAGSTAELHGSRSPRSLIVRSSQKKLDLADFDRTDLSHRVVDLLTPARATIPSTLSRQIILVMSHGGVPTEVFKRLQREQLLIIVDRFSDWTEEDDDNDVRMRLAKAIDEYGLVEQDKNKRSMLASERRAQGLLSRAEASDDFDADETEGFFSVEGRHIWTQKPVHAPTCAHELLLNGFHPASNVMLAGLIQGVAKQSMERILKKFACPVDKSGEAMCIPDPVGVLEDGEIQFRFSRELLDLDTKLPTTHVPEGDALVTRHPCLVPTDIRKVRAVVRPELSAYRDVIIFSTKGKRPLADLLSGGDYDGDLIRCFWDPRIVEPFCNALEKYADCPFDVDQVFDRQTDSVAAFVDKHGAKPRHDRDVALITQLMQPIFVPQFKGMYGKLHLVAAYVHGCDSPEAVEMAHKFNQCMDAPKTGMKLKGSVLNADQKKFDQRLPEWDDKDDGLDDYRKQHPFELEERGPPRSIAKRDQRHKQECVLDVLYTAGKREVNRLKEELTKRIGTGPPREDKALSRPWTEEIEHKQRLSYDVRKALIDHVDTMVRSLKETNAQIAREIDKKCQVLFRGGGSASATRRERYRGASSNPMQRTKSAPAIQLEPGSNQRGMARVQSDVGSCRQSSPVLDEGESDFGDWTPADFAALTQAEHDALTQAKQGTRPEDERETLSEDVFVDAEEAPSTLLSTATSGDGSSIDPAVATPNSTPPTRTPSTTAQTFSPSSSGSSTPILGHTAAPEPPTTPRPFSSGAEVARYFCAWPVKLEPHLAKMDKFDLSRLQMLRASYAYTQCWQYRPKYAFELAWKWLLELKAQDIDKRRREGASHARLQLYPRAVEDVEAGTIRVDLNTWDWKRVRKGVGRRQ